MGTEESKGTTFLIDFGIAKQYHHPSSHIHIPMNGYSQLVGMLAFTSINSHLGGELGRRDDLEALAYTLMFLCSGSLPWLSRHHWHCLTSSSIQFLKELLGTRCPPEVPMELFDFFSHAHGLSFTQKPDYDHLRTILFSATVSLVIAKKETQAISVAQVPHVDSEDNNMYNTP